LAGEGDRRYAEQRDAERGDRLRNTHVLPSPLAAGTVMRDSAITGLGRIVDQRLIGDISKDIPTGGRCGAHPG
jgi:hypothetical protein